MPDEIDVTLANLSRESDNLRERVDQLTHRGLNALRYRPLSEHPLRIDTAAPTDTPPNGTLRLVETGGVRYMYVYTTSSGWEFLAIAPSASGNATYFVAASDASAVAQAQADYVCDGTADDVQIQAALDALSGTYGGTVLLSEGTFSTAATIELPYPVTLAGMGKDGMTVITYSGTSYAISFAGRVSDTTQRVGVYLHDFEVRAASATGTIIDLKGMTRGTVSRVDVHGNKEDQDNAIAGSTGIVLDGSYGGSVGCWWNRIEMCYITGVDTGIHLAGVNNAGQANENAIVQNVIKNIRASGIGIHVEIGDKANIERNDITLTATGTTGIKIEDSISRVIDNRFEQTDTCIDYAGGNRGISHGNTFSSSCTTAYSFSSSGSVNYRIGPDTLGSGITKYSDSSTANDSSLNRLSSGLIPCVFNQDSVAASQTNTQLDVAGTLVTHFAIRRPYQIRGVTFRLDSAPVAGTVTLTPTIAGTKSTTLAITASADAAGSAWQGMGKDENSGSSSVGVEIATAAALDPVTLNIMVVVWVEILDDLV